MVGELWIDIIDKLEPRLGPRGTGPLGYIPRHIKETKVIGRIGGDACCDEVFVCSIISIARLEVPDEAPITRAYLYPSVRGRNACVSHLCSIFPLGFCRKAKLLDDLSFRELVSLLIGDGAPSAISLSLLPCHPHDRIVIVPWMAEVLRGIDRISRAREIIDPYRLIGQNGDNVCAKEVILALQRTCDGLTNDLSRRGYVGCVFGDEYGLWTLTLPEGIPLSLS